jgi:hypothetical protein
MDFKSKVYISDKISLKKEFSLFSEAYTHLKDFDNAKKTFNCIESELKIFNIPA